MPANDTSPTAHVVQKRVLERMSGEARLLLAFDMSIFARELAGKGIQQQHPAWSEQEVKRELLRLAFLPQPLPERLG